MVAIISSEAGSCLVPPSVPTELLCDAGAALILIMLFTGIISTGSAESIAISLLIAFDICRQHFNPEVTNEQIFKVFRVVIIVLGFFIGTFLIFLNETNLNLSWMQIYLFMGAAMSSSILPFWNLMTWTKAYGTGAVVAAWSGFILALVGLHLAAKIQSDTITVDTLGTSKVMLTGNLIAIFCSGTVQIVWSMFFDPPYFNNLDKDNALVEQDIRKLSAEENDPVGRRRAVRWSTHQGYALTLLLILVWPIMSVFASQRIRPLA